jgi:CO/xanthine dehydrogenase Mo-binding subunit
LGLDPVQLRLDLEATTDIIAGQPLAPHFLKECLREDARRFEWSRPTSEPGSMTRRGRIRVCRLHLHESYRKNRGGSHRADNAASPHAARGQHRRCGTGRELPDRDRLDAWRRGLGVL